MNQTITLPPPLPLRKLSVHARRAAKAFERVHELLEAKKAVAVRPRAKKARRAA